MSNYDDFTARDIFTHDDKGNTLYKKGNVHYIINDISLQHELQDIEGYRSFLVTRTLAFILMIPSFFLMGIIIGMLYWLGYDVNDELYNQLLFSIALVLFILVKYIYYRKVSNVLKQCPVLKDEVEHQPIEEVVSEEKEQHEKKDANHGVIELTLLGMGSILFGVHIAITKTLPQGKGVAGLDLADKPYVAYMIATALFLFGLYILKASRRASAKKASMKKAKSIKNKINESMPDLNPLTTVMFFFIAFPTFMFVYYMVKAIIFE